MSQDSTTRTAATGESPLVPGESGFDLVGWRGAEAGDRLALDEIGNDLSNLCRQAAEARLHARDAQSKHASDTEKLLLNLLEVTDAFERVLARIHDKQDGLDQQVKKWVGNFSTVYRMLMQILTDCGVSRIETIDDGFDSRWHSAADVVQDPSRSEGAIVEISRVGYSWHGKVLRKSEVSVVRNAVE